MKRPSNPAAHAARLALTLLELVIVLVILAILTLVAVTSTDSFLDQARYEATQKGLNDIREAIVGPTGATDGISGFVADNGRLPNNLTELLTKPADLSDFAVQPFTLEDGATISMASGWRGPYLRLPPNVSTLKDGWGNDYVFTLGPPLTVQSNGPDSTAGNTDDLKLTLSAPDYQVAGVALRLYEVEAGNKVDPVLDTGDTLSVVVYSVNSTGQVAAQALTATAPTYQVQLSNVPMGTIAVRAVQKSSAGQIKKKSAVQYIRLLPRSTAAQFDLVLKPA